MLNLSLSLLVTDWSFINFRENFNLIFLLLLPFSFLWCHMAFYGESSDIEPQVLIDYILIDFDFSKMLFSNYITKYKEREKKEKRERKRKKRERKREREK